MYSQSVIAADYKWFLKTSNLDSPSCKKVLRQVFELLSKHYFSSENFIIPQEYEIATETGRIAFNEMGLKSEAICLALLWYPFFKNKDFSSDCKQILPVEVIDWLHEAEKIENIDTLKLINQPDNYLKLSLNLLSDIRILLVRIAEFLAILRKEHHDSVEVQSVAQISYHIYAAVLHQLGLYSLNREMLDNAFSVLHPDDYYGILSKLEKSTVKRAEYIEQFCSPLKTALSNAGLKFELKWRTKSIHSIWRKMKVQNVNFEQVFDLFAVRIILQVEKQKEKEACWLAYSLVTSIYEPNPARLRDWITIPKSSGYESLHTTVLGPDHHWVEVQIRSARMDMIAEKGLAAHWKYKGIRTDKSYEEWLNSLREILESPEKNLIDALSGINKPVRTEDVFVFTPKSELKKLKKGATVLDFAFELHTEIGSRCTGARVNNKLVPLKYILQNGDRIEILTSRNQKPTKDWLNFVVTSKAKTKIKRWLTEEQHKFAERGREILKRKLKNWKLEYNEMIVSSLIEHYKLPHSLDLYSGIADGSIDMLEIKALLSGESREEETRQSVVKEEKFRQQPLKTDILIVDPALKNVSYQFGKCCHPIPGDRIFGFITIDKGITIHHEDCPNARFLLTNYPYRRIEACWASDIKDNYFEVSIMIKGEDEIGMANRLTNIVSNTFSVNITSINIESRQNEFSGLFKLQVKHTEQLNQLIERLRRVKGVKSVARIDQ
ncbi:MAG: bifunctional (p)ppGpp synthetase/guanosine-3',5'-bis(diphosphate) 3'-pyrophosphohydrolase [Sphingobacteriales bacterium]|nr:bifunctional (p)ppGpp synthetase/guanosine-3',5'-bis(diphosphate) 3'-pyrophosphohydrolase [Sphingobacteriales bacterium]